MGGGDGYANVVTKGDYTAEDLEKQLGYLRSQGHEVIVWRILDPQEVTFEFDDPKIFEDLESGRRLFVDPVSIRQGYLKRFESHSRRLAEICRQQGVELEVMQTDRPLDESLLEFVRLRSRGRASVQRHSGGSRIATGGVD